MSADFHSRKRSLGTVLVVGGCGFLGSNVVDQLLNFPLEDQTQIQQCSSFEKDAPQKIVDLKLPSLRTIYPVYERTPVHILDLKCTRNKFPGATYHDGDITDPASLLDVFRKVRPDVVINTASPQFDEPRKEILRKVNIDGTRVLLEVAGGAHGDWGGRCKGFVHTSSASVVHNTIDDLINVDERWPLVIPNNVEYYSETKARYVELLESLSC